MKSNRNRIIISLLVFGMLFSLLTANTLSANENEEIEETKEIIEDDSSKEATLDEEMTDTVIGESKEESNNNEMVNVTTMSETLTPYAITDSVFSDSSRPLEQAIITKYQNIDIDGDGYISESEAINFTGNGLDLRNLGVTGTIDGIHYFKGITLLYMSGNSFSGEIPPELGTMTKLVRLYLDQNQFNGEIPSELGLLENLTHLYLYQNKLSGSIPSELGQLTELKQLYLNQNNLSGNIPPELGSLVNLTNFYIYHNNLSGEIPSTIANLTKLKAIYWHENQLTGHFVFTKPMPDLTILYTFYNGGLTVDIGNLNSVSNIGISTAINANLDNTTVLYLTGTKEHGESIVRVRGSAGFISWDPTTTYYELSTGSTYEIGAYFNGTMKVSSVVEINDSAIMDNQGNLILGATLDNVVDGKVYLPNGGTVITGDATYILESEATVKEKEITTSGNYTIETNHADENGVVTKYETIGVDVKEGSEVTININGNGTIDLIPGSVISTSKGDEVYMIDGGSMTTNGTIIPNDVMITVPSGSVSSITTNEKEDTLPAGTSVTMNGETVTYPGTIIIDTMENTVTYLPVDSLFDETRTGLASGITQQDIEDALTLVNSITPGALQDELLAKIADAQSMMDAKNEAEGLLNTNQDDLVSGVDQNAITNAGNLINDLVDGSFKDALQSLVDKAQAIFDAIKSVNDLYNDDKSDLVVGATQAMIDSAQNAVDKLDPNSDKAKELQKLIDDAQTILNNREAATNAVDNLFNDKKDNLATDITQDDIKNAQDLVNKLPDGEYKDNLQKEIDKAQAMQDAKDAANDLLDKDGNLNSNVTQEDIDNAQDLVNKLPAGELKDELQLIIDEAQKQLDEKNISKPSTAPGTTVKPSVDSTSTTGGSNVNTGDETNMTLYMGLFALSLAGIVLVVRKRKLEE